MNYASVDVGVGVSQGVWVWVSQVPQDKRVTHFVGLTASASATAATQRLPAGPPSVVIL